MAQPVAALPFPAMPKSASRWSESAGHTLLDVDGRQVVVLRTRLNDAKLTELAPYFPLHLLPTRAAYLPQAARQTLKLAADTELLVEAMLPEVLGPTPLAQWQFRAEEVAALAQANAASGALVVQLEGRQKKAGLTRRVFTPLWLDWQGWVGVARRVAQAPQLPDAATLRYMAYELGQRDAQAPTGLHTAQAHLFAALDSAMEAASACQDELVLSLDARSLPSIGALEALVLLGKLLKSHGDDAEARAALSLALWLNPNHQEASVEMLPLLDAEQTTETLARVGKMPQRPAAYGELLRHSAERLKITPGGLETRVEAASKAAGTARWQQPPSWVNEGQLRTWLPLLGL